MANVVTDALSPIDTNVLISGQPLTVDFAAMVKTQATNSQIRSLQSSASSILVVDTEQLESSSLLRLVLNALSSHFLGDALCLILFMDFHTLV